MNDAKVKAKLVMIKETLDEAADSRMDMPSIYKESYVIDVSFLLTYIHHLQAELQDQKAKYEALSMYTLTSSGAGLDE